MTGISRCIWTLCSVFMRRLWLFCRCIGKTFHGCTRNKRLFCQTAGEIFFAVNGEEEQIETIKAMSFEAKQLLWNSDHESSRQCCSRLDGGCRL